MIGGPDSSNRMGPERYADAVAAMLVKHGVYRTLAEAEAFVARYSLLVAAATKRRWYTFQTIRHINEREAEGQGDLSEGETLWPARRVALVSTGDGRLTKGKVYTGVYVRVKKRVTPGGRHYPAGLRFKCRDNFGKPMTFATSAFGVEPKAKGEE